SEVMSNSNRAGLSDAVIDPLKCTNCDPAIVVLSGQWDQEPGWSKSEYHNNNNHSLVIRVEFGELWFLFPGDLEEDGIKSLLAYYEEGGNPPDVFDVDIYHAGTTGPTTGPPSSGWTRSHP